MSQPYPGMPGWTYAIDPVQGVILTSPAGATVYAGYSYGNANVPPQSPFYIPGGVGAAGIVPGMPPANPYTAVAPGGGDPGHLVTPGVNPGVPGVGAGGIGTQSGLAQLQAQYGAGNVKTPTANFNFPWRGTIVQFTAGTPQVLDAALLAALTAAGAPLV